MRNLGVSHFIEREVDWWPLDLVGIRGMLKLESYWKIFGWDGSRGVIDFFWESCWRGLPQNIFIFIWKRQIEAEIDRVFVCLEFLKSQTFSKLYDYIIII